MKAFLSRLPALARRLYGRAHAALILCLAASAPALMLLCQYQPDVLPVFWCFPAAVVVLTTLCMCLRSWRRVLAAVPCLAAIAYLGWVSLPLAQQPVLVLLPLGACAALVAALPLAVSHARGMHPAVYTAGLFVQLGAHVVAHLSERMPRPQYTPVLPAMTAVFIVYLFLCMLTLNETSMHNSTMGRHQPPASIRRFNTVLVYVFTALSLVLAALPAVARAIVRAWDLLAAGAAYIVRLILSLMPESGPMGAPGQGGGDEMVMMPMEQAEPSLLAVILERIALIVALLLFAALLALAVRILYKKLRALLAYLAGRLQQYIAAVSSEEDEITDTREEGGERRSILPRRLARRAEHDPKTPTGRIRRAYARLLRRHEDWQGSSTARENLPDAAAALYERARYSEHPVTDEDAEIFITETRKS